MKKKINGVFTVIQFRNLALSILLHIILLGLLSFASKPNLSKEKISAPNNQVYLTDLVSIPESKGNSNLENSILDKRLKMHSERIKNLFAKISEGNFSNVSTIDADTSSLEQLYSEGTLNVSIKYPLNWTYLDQDLNKKLQGVTFWATGGVSIPPPYVHLEVKGKDLFNSGSYKYKIKNGSDLFCYNDPEEIDDQYILTVYIRTGSENDFGAKLIINGKTAYEIFKPVFFGMLKSLKHGNSLF